MRQISEPAVVIRKANDNGKNTFHPKRINWSYLYLGYATRAHIKKNKTKAVLNPNDIKPGKRGAHQPPKNKREVRQHMNKMFALSPRKNNAKPMAEYSTKYPATNSASASGKSKGWRLVSAKAEMKNMMNNGNKGIQ